MNARCSRAQSAKCCLVVLARQARVIDGKSRDQDKNSKAKHIKRKKVAEDRSGLVLAAALDWTLFMMKGFNTFEVN